MAVVQREEEIGNRRLHYRKKKICWSTVALESISDGKGVHQLKGNGGG